MSIQTVFDIICARTPEMLNAALEAHKHAKTDEAEETIITQFLDDQMEETCKRSREVAPKGRLVTVIEELGL